MIRGVRPLRCATVLLLGLGTQHALAPLVGGGPDVVDLPLLVLLWFALVDRPGRLLLLAAGLVFLRLQLGVSSIAEVALPILGALLVVRLARGGVDPRDPTRRLVIVAGALLTAAAIARALWSIPLAGSSDHAATGVLLGCLAAALLFPLLDRLSPWLRSATHPM